LSRIVRRFAVLRPADGATGMLYPGRRRHRQRGPRRPRIRAHEMVPASGEMVPASGNRPQRDVRQSSGTSGNQVATGEA